MAVRKRVFFLILTMVLTLQVGVIGYELIEGWDFLDSLFMSVITLATVGYGETHPLSPAGRVFTIFLILSGISTVSYVLLALTTMVTDGDLVRHWKRKKMEKVIAKLRDHYVVCGAGKTGLFIVSELLNAGKPVVVIDIRRANLHMFESPEHLLAHFGKDFGQPVVCHLEGDASLDKSLIEAGVEHAQGVFCALANDKDNLFVALTARGLNPHVRIVAKCQDDESIPKFSRIGVDRIVLLNRIGGLRMASEMIRPGVVSFLDVMIRDPQGYRFEEINIAANSPFLGKPVQDSPLGRDKNLRIVALTTDGKKFQYNPPLDTPLSAGQRFVVLAFSEGLEKLRQAINPG